LFFPIVCVSQLHNVEWDAFPVISRLAVAVKKLAYLVYSVCLYVGHRHSDLLLIMLLCWPQ